MATSGWLWGGGHRFFLKHSDGQWGNKNLIVAWVPPWGLQLGPAQPELGLAWDQAPIHRIDTAEEEHLFQTLPASEMRGKKTEFLPDARVGKNRPFVRGASRYFF